VIQKQKLHHSNIYSGAPMPFMQRITWSGIAMHAGVLPGYPASHGCIRMPMAFAVKMYGWTKMGARVVVTPGELTPTSFSHPLLATQKVVPQPVAADMPRAEATAKGDKSAATDPAGKSETSVASLDLRLSIGHDSRMPAAMDAPKPQTEPTRTADASSSPAITTSVTMSDAAPSTSPESGNAALTASAAPAAEDAVSDQATGATPEPKSGAVKSVAELLAANGIESENKSVEAKPPEAAAPEIKATEAVAADHADKKNDQAPASVDAAKTEAKDDITAQTPPGEIAKAAPKPDESIAATTNEPAADAKKDQARPSDNDKAAPAKPALAMAKGTGPISVFVSRKDSKLYVRQNFAPLFDVPVSIAPSDRPLGTHIFTAEADKNDSNMLHWSVVTLPSRNAERRDDDERASRHRKIAGAAEIAKPAPVADSPAEALDRLTIPADAMARINEALSTGGSIIVSDQGIAAGETGEGTDFIVSLR
jgi:L,D-transpeptidase catalytic domain